MMDLEPDLLRTFVAFAETGSLVRAAAIVGRTPSAVTAQIKRLEDIVGEAVLAPAGRGRVLSETGTELLGMAREILDLHRNSLLRLRGQRLAGRVTVAATQDFAESSLPRLLRLFAETSPLVKIEVRIGRTSEINAAFAANETDIALAMRGEADRHELALIEDRTHWFSAADGLAGQRMLEDVPLALLDPPCGFRTEALAALARVGRGYRIAATSQTLAGLKTAVLAGLAVTLRTKRWLGPGLAIAPPGLGLPDTAPAIFSLRLRAESGTPARQLAELLAAELPL
jgi:DNA-binding transcriptional LysR family regulator